jgi:DNA-binding transcriptional LysR family regulator
MLRHMVSDSRTFAFQELHCFSEVARKGGITAAASAMGVSKSAVSKYITRLEERLGVKLLERSSRRVRLTSAGERLLPRVESIMADGQRLLEQAVEERAEPAGLVRVAATPELGSVVAQAFFPRVNQRYPSLQLAMSAAYRFEDLQDPAYDFAIRVGRVADDRLVARRLGQFRRVLVASPSYLERRPVEKPADLAGANALIFSARRTESNWTLVRFGDDANETRVDVHGSAAVQSFTTLAEMARQGLGVAYIPDFVVADAIRDGSLIRCLPQFHSHPTFVMLAYRFGSDRIRRVRVVLEMANEEIPKLLSEPAK